MLPVGNVCILRRVAPDTHERVAIPAAPEPRRQTGHASALDADQVAVIDEKNRSGRSGVNPADVAESTRHHTDSPRGGSPPDLTPPRLLRLGSEVHRSIAVPREAVVPQKSLGARDDESHATIRPALPDVVTPLVDPLALVPEVFPEQIPLRIEIKLVGVNAGNDDLFRPIGREAPHLFQIRVVDVSSRVDDDADGRMSQGAETCGKEQTGDEKAHLHIMRAARVSPRPSTEVSLG